jgi:hypothetical protein
VGVARLQRAQNKLLASNSLKLSVTSDSVVGPPDFLKQDRGPLRGYGSPLPDSPSRRTISRTMGRNSMMAKNSVASQMSRRRNRTRVAS